MQKSSIQYGGMRSQVALSKDSALPLVTVITAVFNAKNNLAECLESVLCQDYPNIEHIVIDGGSTDGTIDLLREYSDRIAFWQSERDQGVYDAWNKGLALAQGEWICFLGADDRFLPGAISTYMHLASENPKAEFLSSREWWIHPSGYRRLRGEPWKWAKFSRRNCIAHVGSMHRRSLFDRVGNYDLTFGTASDYELLLRSRNTLQAAFTPAITVVMRGGGMTDRRCALADATKASTLTGGRNPILANLDLTLANIKFYLRPLRRLGNFKVLTQRDV